MACKPDTWLWRLTLHVKVTRTYKWPILSRALHMLETWFVCVCGGGGCWILWHRVSNNYYRHQTQVSMIYTTEFYDITIYTTRDIVVNELRRVCDSCSSSFHCLTKIIIDAFILFCQSKITIVNVIFTYMLVKIFFWHMLYVIQKYVKKCLTSNFKPEVKVTTLIYIFLIPRHRFSTYRHHTQVSVIYTTKDITLNALCHVWPWISKSKVKFIAMRPIFSNSLTST